MRTEKKIAKTKQAQINKEQYQEFLNQARDYRWRYYHIRAANETGNGEHEGFFKITSLFTVPYDKRELFIAAVDQAGKENHVETIADEEFVYAVADPTDDPVNDGVFDR